MSPNSHPSLTQLFTSFLRLGAAAFGGPSMIAYIRQMAVEKQHWLDAATFSEGIALCQAIPGATAMQAAAYVGLRTRGVLGAAAAFVGFGLPGFVLTIAFALFYSAWHDLPLLVSALSGLQAVVVAMMINATVSFGRGLLGSWRHLLIGAAAASLFGAGVDPILVIVFSSVAGLAFLRTDQPTRRTPRSDKPVTRTSGSVALLVTTAAIGLLLLYLFHQRLFHLAILMLRIDLFAFGGAFASIPLMFREVVDVRGWIDGQTFMNAIVFGQISPGPVVKTAVFVGFLLDGLAGSVVAGIGIFLPSFVLLVAVAPYFERLRASPSFERIMAGILCSFIGLLLTVTLRFALDLNWDIRHVLLGLAALIALVRKVDILWVVVAGALFSVWMLI